jgi:DNA repair exonuclease SbcCD ATPase subunit
MPEASSPSIPSHLVNKGTRKWVFGSFEVPPGPGRVVEIPARLHPDNDELDAKYKAILLKNIDHENAELVTVPTGAGAKVDPVALKIRDDELATLRAQVDKLQKLVAAGDAGDLSKELEATNRELQTLLEEAEARGDKAVADAKALFDQVTALTNAKGALETQVSDLTSRNESLASELQSAGNRVAELENQLKAALGGKKK